MNSAPAIDLAATLARLDAAADHYAAEVERLNSAANAAKAAGDSEALADIREDRERAQSLFDYASNRAFALRASR